MIVFLYAPWCGHCKTFKPTWNKIKKKYSGKIQTKEINSDKQPQEIKKYKVEGFPTVLFMKGNQRIEYQGDRSAEDLDKFFQNALNQSGGGRGSRGRGSRGYRGGGNKMRGGAEEEEGENSQKDLYQTLSVVSAAFAAFFFYLSRMG